MTKGLLLYNPYSGDQSIKNKLDYIFERFQSQDIILIPYRMFQSDSFSEFLLRILKEDRFSFVILSGGDGSLNFITNFWFYNGINLPLGIFPCGTCNDFARNIGLSKNPDDWIDIILSGQTRFIDAGCINDHQYFLGNIGGGLFANVSFNTQNEQKKNLGPVAYYLNALNELPQIGAFNIKVDTENCHIDRKVILFLVLNGSNVAGFSNFFKEADNEDSMMDILLFPEAGPMELANLFLKMLSNELAGDRLITHLRARECRIQADKQVQITVDGEKGTCLPVRVRCVHPGLQIFMKKP